MDQSGKVATMAIGKENYYPRLARGDMSEAALEAIGSLVRNRLSVQTVDEQLLLRSPSQQALPSQVRHLLLQVAHGARSWSGLVVGFPGTREDLSTSHVGTPFLRMVLYPILELHARAMNHYQVDLPCLYLLGERFSDVFIRKFRFLAQAVQHAIILTSDILVLNTSVHEISGERNDRESYVQNVLCRKMAQEGLSLHTRDGELNLAFLAKELPTCEGTRNPERLDILAVDKNDGSLVAFELKGPKAGRLGVENLFFQGLEHRDWLERNKMAIKFVIEGPKGIQINTRKRVKLVLGLFTQYIPPLFLEFRRRATAKDPYLDIRFVRLTQERDSQVRICDVQ